MRYSDVMLLIPHLPRYSRFQGSPFLSDLVPTSQSAVQRCPKRPLVKISRVVASSKNKYVILRVFYLLILQVVFQKPSLIIVNHRFYWGFWRFPEVQHMSSSTPLWTAGTRGLVIFSRLYIQSECTKWVSQSMRYGGVNSLVSHLPRRWHLSFRRFCPLVICLLPDNGTIF